MENGQIMKLKRLNHLRKPGFSPLFKFCLLIENSWTFIKGTNLENDSYRSGAFYNRLSKNGFVVIQESSKTPHCTK